MVKWLQKCIPALFFHTTIYCLISASLDCVLHHVYYSSKPCVRFILLIFMLSGVHLSFTGVSYWIVSNHVLPLLFKVVLCIMANSTQQTYKQGNKRGQLDLSWLWEKTWRSTCHVSPNTFSYLLKLMHNKHVYLWPGNHNCKQCMLNFISLQLLCMSRLI